MKSILQHCRLLMVVRFSLFHGWNLVENVLSIVHKLATPPILSFTARYDYYNKCTPLMKISQPLYGGKRHRVTTDIRRVGEKKPFLKLEGEWNGVLYTKLPNKVVLYFYLMHTIYYNNDTGT